ncbi:hypothetical protein GMDG_08904, partial [Pseudogymnoascus destructans 20631-21]
RDSLIKKLVGFKLAIEDGADELLATIRIMRDAGSDATTIDMLLRCHLRLCRPAALDANDMFDIFGPQDFLHREVADPVAWLVADNARRKAEAA